MKMEQLRADDLCAGMELPFDLYDGNHTLLMRHGLVVTDVILEKLSERGLFGDSTHVHAVRELAAALASGRKAETRPRTASVSIFQLLNEAQSALEALLGDPSRRAQIGESALGIAADVQKACRLDSDAAIASVLLDRQGRYPFRRAVNTAVLVELMLCNLEPDAARRLPVIAAALTRDIAVLDLLEALDQQSTPPTAAQKAEILAHPAAGVELLKGAGVAEAAWLDAVAQHHEQPDGSGYPRRICGEAIKREARLIGLAERYGAMITARGQRPPLPSSAAFKKLVENKQTWDPAIGAILARELGAYPPGSYVRLAKGELAIVVKRGGTPNQPFVRVLLGPHGLKLEGFPKRNTKEPNFHIVGSVAQAEVRVEHDFRDLWDLTTIVGDSEPETAFAHCV